MGWEDTILKRLSVHKQLNQCVIVMQILTTRTRQLLLALRAMLKFHFLKKPFNSPCFSVNQPISLGPHFSGLQSLKDSPFLSLVPVSWALWRISPITHSHSLVICYFCRETLRERQNRNPGLEIRGRRLYIKVSHFWKPAYLRKAALPYAMCIFLLAEGTAQLKIYLSFSFSYSLYRNFLFSF